MSLLHDISGVSTCRGSAGQVCVESRARACEFSKPAESPWPREYELAFIYMLKCAAICKLLLNAIFPGFGW